MKSRALVLWFVTYLCVSVAAADLPWPDTLCLGQGGYWPKRLVLTCTNTTSADLQGKSITVTIPELAGERVESLRVCRADGTELLYDLRDSAGSPKRTGALQQQDQLIIPLECPARQTTTVLVYAGNLEAWPVTDYLPESEAHNASNPGARGVEFEPNSLETLELHSAGPLPPRIGSALANWAEVRVRNLSQQPQPHALVRLNLRQALAYFSIPADADTHTADRNGEPVPSFRWRPGMLLISASLPPRSEEHFRVGFDPAVRINAKAAATGYAQLLSSSANLFPDGDFENGSQAPAGWLKPAEARAHSWELRNVPEGRFGRRSLQLTVSRDPAGAWAGWHSREIPVRPGATYYLSGWLKATDLRGTAAIHAHFHNARGELTRSGAMVSTQPAVSGTSDWVNSDGFFEAPPDAATIEVHLTMNAAGTLNHDGLILCEVVDGSLVGVHSPTEAEPGPSVRAWQVNPLVRVFPDNPPREPVHAVAVELGRVEFSPFELAVRSDAPETVGLEISVSPLTNAAGAALPAVEVQRIGYVPIDYPSAYYTSTVPAWCRKLPKGAPATDGWAGWWPDPLAPANHVELLPNRTQPLWFTVHAPPGAAPGLYRATATLSPTEQAPLSIPLEVRVLPFSLPERGHLRAIFDLRFGPGGTFGSGAGSREEQRQWLRFMAEHRLGINEIQPPPKFTYKEGRVSMDATGFDETAHFCFDELGMNVSYTPEFFYLFGWAYPPKKIFGLEPFTPEWTSALQQAYRLFSDHLREKGWHDRFVYYISDEPHFQHPFVVEQMKKLCAIVHAVDATIPIYSSTWRPCPAWNESLDLWGIGQYGCFPVADLEPLRRAGKGFWFTCDGQMATDTPYLATERLLPYYCFRYGVSGFEFWGLAWWTYNPWQVGWHQFIRQSDEGKKFYWVRYPNGDGYLAYPGQPVGHPGPMSTIRLEEIRQGLQDYEALHLLTDALERARQEGRSLGSGENALRLARELVQIPNAGGHALVRNSSGPRPRAGGAPRGQPGPGRAGRRRAGARRRKMREHPETAGPGWSNGRRNGRSQGRFSYMNPDVSWRSSRCARRLPGACFPFDGPSRLGLTRS